MDAWTSFANDPRDSTVYSAANGGHNDYAGNEVDRIRLSDDVPAWTEVRASTPVSQISIDVDHYADGRPTPRHSYCGATFDERRGRVLVLSGHRFGNGNVTAAFDGFNPATSDWDAARTYPDVLSEFANTSAAAVVRHSGNGDLYVFANWSLMRWNNAANTWSRALTNTSIYGQSSASAYDSKRNRILVAAGINNEHALYDVAGNSVQPVSFTGAGAGAVSGSYIGLVYDADSDRYLMKKSEDGGTVYTIDPQSFAVNVLATTGGAVPNAVNGVFRRFLHAPQLGGVVYAPTYGGNLWFLKTRP